MTKVSDEEFNRLKADKMHKELISAVKSIKIPLNTDNTPQLNEIKDVLLALVNKMSNTEPMKVVLPKQENNQKEILDVLKELKGAIEKLNKEEKPKEWDFQVVRDLNNNIHSVKVKQL